MAALLRRRAFSIYLYLYITLSGQNTTWWECWMCAWDGRWIKNGDMVSRYFFILNFEAHIQCWLLSFAQSARYTCWQRRYVTRLLCQKSGKALKSACACVVWEIYIGHKTALRCAHYSLNNENRLYNRYTACMHAVNRAIPPVIDIECVYEKL
jgi:hypothetical protein